MAIPVEQLRVTHSPCCERLDIAGDERFKALRRMRAGENRLPHMRHVEQPGLSAGMKMFLDDAEG